MDRAQNSKHSLLPFSVIEAAADGNVDAISTIKEYLENRVEAHGKANLRPSTFDGYKGYIRNHVVPTIGHIPLKQPTPAMIDDMFQKLYAKGLSHSSVRYTQRI